MSDEETSEADRLAAVYRTITPPFDGGPELDAIGWGYVILLAVVFVPFLPAVVAVWVVVKLIEEVTNG